MPRPGAYTSLITCRVRQGRVCGMEWRAWMAGMSGGWEPGTRGRPARCDNGLDDRRAAAPAANSQQPTASSQQPAAAMPTLKVENEASRASTSASTGSPGASSSALRRQGELCRRNTTRAKCKAREQGAPLEEVGCRSGAITGGEGGSDCAWGCRGVGPWHVTPSPISCTPPHPFHPLAQPHTHALPPQQQQQRSPPPP